MIDIGWELQHDCLGESLCTLESRFWLLILADSAPPLAGGICYIMWRWNPCQDVNVDLTPRGLPREFKNVICRHPWHVYISLRQSRQPLFAPTPASWSTGRTASSNNHKDTWNCKTSIWMFPKIVVPPNHPSKNRVFHYKPSILGYPYFWKHPYELTPEVELSQKKCSL